MRPYIAMSTLLLAVGCYHGPSLAKFEPAHGPAGINADLQVRNPRVRKDILEVHGELLEVQDTSLTLLDSGRIVMVPVRTVEQGSFGDLGMLLSGGSDAKDALARLRNFCRFPAGLTPELRARLLAAYGQTAVQVLP